jgi:hypothetical protein
MNQERDKEEIGYDICRKLYEMEMEGIVWCSDVVNAVRPGRGRGRGTNGHQNMSQSTPMMALGLRLWQGLKSL